MIIGGAIATIPGLPEWAQQKLMGVFNSQPRLQEVWLYGSRAMGRERPASDVDLCLTGETLGHGDLLRLMAGAHQPGWALHLETSMTTHAPRTVITPEDRRTLGIHVPQGWECSIAGAAFNH